MNPYRSEFATRRILLREPEQVERAIAALRNAPLDPIRPIECLIREEVKARKKSQNDMMWAGPLADIAAQVWVEGRQYRAEVWHEHFKETYLPEEYDPELCKSEDYRKWDIGPSGRRILVGSSTDLTRKGFAQYVTEIEVFGAERGVEYHAPPMQR